VTSPAFAALGSRGACAGFALVTGRSGKILNGQNFCKNRSFFAQSGLIFSLFERVVLAFGRKLPYHF